MCLLLGKIIKFKAEGSEVMKGRILDNPLMYQVGHVVNKYVVLIIDDEGEETDKLCTIYPYEIKNITF